MKRGLLRVISFAAMLALLASRSTLSAAADGYDEYTLETAIQTGLENCILLGQLENQLELSELKYRAYRKIGSDLVDGKTELSTGGSSLEDALSEIASGQQLLNQARIDIQSGYYPKGFPEQAIIEETGLPDGSVLPALVITPDHDEDDSNRRTILAQFTEYADAHVDILYAAGIELDPVEDAQEVVRQVKLTIKQKQKLLDEGKSDYEENLLALVEGKIDYAVAKANISSALAEKLDISELNKLSPEQDKKLLIKMAKAAVTINEAAQGIYRNQTALLIQNNYYTVLKTEKLLEAKKQSLKRAELQYSFVRDGYEVGLKTKDSLLLAELYYTGAKLEYEKELDDYNNALLELKKNMNISMDKQIRLREVELNNNITVDLEEGLEQGLAGRLEVIKAGEQLNIYKENLELVGKRYNDKSTQYKEALKLKDNAALELEKAKLEVESSIRKSYSTMETMKSLLESSEQMTEQAEECLEIARARYESGLGAGSDLMSSLGLSSVSGTLLEVVSAEENLAKVEEKYIEVLYGYNLSKAKYLNDIACIIY